MARQALVAAVALCCLASLNGADDAQVRAVSDGQGPACAGNRRACARARHYCPHDPCARRAQCDQGAGGGDGAGDYRPAVRLVQVCSR